jgi:hypothetical protein
VVVQTMIAEGVDTPEQAAMFGFPERLCHVVASEIHGEDAFGVWNQRVKPFPFGERRMV